jgi:opacity protein-like surface antigen
MSGRPRLSRSALALAVLAFTGSLGAQQAPAHHGPFIGVGLGYGSAKLSCSLCDVSRQGEISGFAKLGFALTQQFLIGVEADVWRDKTTISKQLTSFGLSLWMYPSRTSGFYLKAGGGWSKYSASDNDDEFNTTAFSGQVGVGYEVAVAKSVSVGPYVNFIGTSSSDFRFNDTVIDGSANTSLIQIGMSVTVH